MAKVNDVKNALSNKGEITMQPASNTLVSLIQSVNIRKKFEDVLGKKAPAFLSSLLAIYNNSENLKKVEPMSILSSAMIAATLDLPINQNLGFAHIIAYFDKKTGKTKAQFQMGYKAYVQLAQRTGTYRNMTAEEVYEGELIEKNRFIDYLKFDETKKISNKIIGFVSYFKRINGFEKYLYMTTEQINAHAKKYSKTYNTGCWQNNYIEMGKKTVLKLLLSKFGILSTDIQNTDIQRAIEYDQAEIKENGEINYIDNPTTNIDNTNIDIENTVDSKNISENTSKEKENDKEEIPFGE